MRVQWLWSIAFVGLSVSHTSGAGTTVCIPNVPHVRQKTDFCGEACVAMVLQSRGWNVDQDFVFNQAKLNPIQARGCHTNELKTALDRIGFKVGRVWYSIRASHAKQALEDHFLKMVKDLRRGVPSIVCMRYDSDALTTEHFRLILGYDAKRDEVIYHEPAEATGAYQRMSRALFLSLWPLKYSATMWTVIRFRLAGKHLNISATDKPFSAADYAQHLMAMKDSIPAGFTVVLEPPFVVIGDEQPDEVKARAVETVRRVTRRVMAMYFHRDPSAIITIWLFRDKESYERNCRALFGVAPETPYGYYSPDEQALVMNIATGGGTLVHEMIHPFIEANFPNCPAWFNEGLASLYEQCVERNGQLVGLTNWRLAGLQMAIRAGELPSFAKLCALTDDEFYDQDPGTNYAQARYLCYYLQQHGQLEQYYHAFQRSRTDRTGYSTLQRILGGAGNSMKQFQQQWEQWILALRYPERPKP